MNSKKKKIQMKKGGKQKNAKKGNYFIQNKLTQLTKKLKKCLKTTNYIKDFFVKIMVIISFVLSFPIIGAHHFDKFF